MKHGLLIFFILLLIGIIFKNELGLPIADEEEKGDPQGVGVEMVEEQGVPPANSLQLRRLVPVTLAPQPTLPPATSPTPTTTGPKLCQGKNFVLDFLIDTSGSIGGSDRTVRILQTIMNVLDDNIIIGAQGFDEPPAYTIVAFNTVRVNRSALLGVRSTRNNTYIKDGFIFANDAINSAQGSYPRSGYRWIMVFISDGIPNDKVPPDPWPEGPDPAQDPTIPQNISVLNTTKARVNDIVSVKLPFVLTNTAHFNIPLLEQLYGVSRNNTQAIIDAMKRYGSEVMQKASTGRVFSIDPTQLNSLEAYFRDVVIPGICS